MRTLLACLLACYPLVANAQNQTPTESRSIALVLRDRDEAANALLLLKGQLQDVDDVRGQVEFANDALRRLTLPDEPVATLMKRTTELTEAHKAKEVPFRLLEAFCAALSPLGDGFDNISALDAEYRARLRVASWLALGTPALQGLTGPVESTRSRLPAARRRLSLLPTDLRGLRETCFDKVMAENPNPRERMEIATALIDGMSKSDSKAIGAQFASTRDAAREPWNQALQTLQALSTAKGKERDDFIARIKLLDHEVGNADTRLAAQEAVDSKLVYATYGMIVALFILGLMLIRSDKVRTSVLIEQRTIVELVSIGFMLVTIIILGAGKRLTGETLGALLGTIAGYVFGREVAHRKLEQSGQPGGSTTGFRSDRPADQSREAAVTTPVP
jgi:hypothetical protein